MGASIQINGATQRSAVVPFGVAVSLTNAVETGTSQKWELLRPPLDEDDGTPDFGVNFAGWTAAGDGSYFINQPTSPFAAVTFKPDVTGTYIFKLTSTESGGSTAVQTAVVRVKEIFSGEHVPAAGETSEEGTLHGHAKVVNGRLKRLARRMQGAIRVVNVSGSQIARGKVVKLGAPVDGHAVSPNVDPGGTAAAKKEKVYTVTVADNTAAGAADADYAILDETLANNAFGWALKFGVFEGKGDVDYSTFTAGTKIYFNSTGTQVATPPAAGAKIPIGTLLEASATGALSVRLLGRMHQGGNATIASAANAVWGGIEYPAATLTLTGTTQVTVAAGLSAHEFQAPTISGAGPVTVDHAATVTIAGPPVEGGGVTLTNTYALRVLAGKVKLADGELDIERDSLLARLSVTAYGNAASGIPLLRLFSSRGTKAAASAIQSGDDLGGIASVGRGATTWADPVNAKIGFLAEENFTDTATGTAIYFSTTAIGTETFSEKMRLTSEGNLGIGTPTPKIIGSPGRAITLSAGTTGDNTAYLEMQGSTTGDDEFATIYFHHQATRAAGISAQRAGADARGMLRFLTRGISNTLLSRLDITEEGVVVIDPLGAPHGTPPSAAVLQVVSGGAIEATMTGASAVAAFFRAGDALAVVRDTTGDVETAWGLIGSAGFLGTISNHAMQLGSNNAVRATFAADGSTLTLTPRVLSPDGALTTPAYAFSSETNSGWRRAGASDVRAVIAGADRLRITASGSLVDAITTATLYGGALAGRNDASPLRIVGGAVGTLEGLIFTPDNVHNAASGAQKAYRIHSNFAPTSGTATFRHLSLDYIVNQTGGANGAVTGLYLDATETAVGGTHNLMDLRVGGALRFQVRNDGAATHGGTISMPQVTKTGAYTITDSDHTIFADATGAAFTVTLPPAAGRAGYIFHIKRLNAGSNDVTVGSNGGNIDGAATFSIATQYQSITVQSDGANWWII